MVAAEAAACGVLPVSAAHSGLAEVSDVLAGAVPEQAAPWLSFAVDDDAVEGARGPARRLARRRRRAALADACGPRRDGPRALVVGAASHAA